jgi:hypothetical protein
MESSTVRPMPNQNTPNLDSESLTKTVTASLAASIVAAPQRFWGVLRRLGHKQNRPLPQAMRAGPNATPTRSRAGISAI